MLEFRVLEEKGRFKIRDARNACYGTYDKRKEAEMYMQLWIEYYQAPMVF